MHQQIHIEIGVDPLVVVSWHEEAFLAWQVVLESGLGFVDEGVDVVHEILRHELFIAAPSLGLAVLPN